MKIREITSLTTSISSARFTRLGFSLLSALLLALLVAPSAPVAAADNVGTLPTVKGFTSARFDFLTTITASGEQEASFGSGSAIIPGKVQAWIGNNRTSVRTGVVQIGSDFYVNDGTGWKRSDIPLMGGINALPVGEQLAELGANASSVVKIGDTTFRGVAVSQYQVVLTGENALKVSGVSESLTPELRELINKATYKYDFWIGTQDGQLYQQNTFITIPAGTLGGQAIPASESNSLVTYRDFDDPSISVVAPI